MNGDVKPLRVFLCHASSDKPVVRELYKKLSESGYQPWLDEEDLLPGQEWEREIRVAVRASDVVIVCLSPASTSKQGFVQKEIKLVLDVADEQPEGTIFVIPARLAACDVPERLRRWHWVNLYEDGGYVKLVKALEHRAKTLQPVPDKCDRKRFTTAKHKKPRQAGAAPIDAAEDADRDATRAEETALGRMFEFDTVTLDEVGNVASRLQKQARQFVEELAPGITLEMVSIPGGTFMMGSPEEEEGSDDNERPQHQVTVSRFHMGKFPVTQAQWRVVAGWPKVERELNAEPSRFKGDDRPVEQVSWEEVVEFCARLASRTEKGYRLPTEGEWEYACRAGTRTPFAFGETVSSDFVNYDGRYPYGFAAIILAPEGRNRGETVPVGSLGVANGFGLYDMHGNVSEWCQDWGGGITKRAL
jgi:formylglycine-generating enzyme required for sulfatase activity